VSDPHERLLEQLRPAAFAVAYRMLGSVSEAEDVVQESLLRLHAALERGERIESPRVYLATVATRLAIDELRSARARRETYIGEWLPEPLVDEPVDDPAQRVEMADSLSVAFLVLLESLTPEERAVLILHDVFDYGYGEVAEVIGKSEDNSRQLAVRARRHVEEGRPRFEGSPERREELGERFFAAAERGDLDELRRCCPATSSCAATAAARCRRSPGPCTVPTGSRGRSSTGASKAPEAGPACAAWRSTACRARSWSTPTGRRSPRCRSKSAATGSSASTPWSTPRSSATSARSATCGRCCGRGGTPSWTLGIRRT
jgi:RNA polymerase sigma factor (sigma-70 family)